MKFILQYLKERYKSVMAYSLGMTLILWMYVSLYPTILQQSEALMETLKSYPESMTKAFGITELSFSKLSSFLAMEYFSMIWPIVAIILIISFVGGAIAGEVERGTIELILSEPISRLRLYWSRVASVGVISVVFLLFSIVIIKPLASLYSVAFDFDTLLAILVMAGSFYVAIFGISFLISAWASEKSKVGLILSVGLIVMYVLDIISKLKTNLESLKYGSFFHYMHIDQAAKNAEIYGVGVLVLMSIGLACLFLGSYIFKNRDIAT